MNRKLHISSDIANWNDARSKCRDKNFELFQLEEKKDQLANNPEHLSSPSFWVGFKKDERSNLCPVIRFHSWDVDFDTEQCNLAHKYICEESLVSERYLSTKTLLILVFLGVFIYFAIFFIHASRTQSKHELKQKNINTELSEFNEESPESVQSI